MDLPVNYDKLHWTERKAAREQYIKTQKGLCHYCKQPLALVPSKEVTDKWVDKTLFPSSFFKWPVHLHHSHATGMTIGAVHNYCNAVLWQYEGECITKSPLQARLS